LIIGFQIDFGIADFAGVALVTVLYLYMRSRRPKNRKIEETIVA
jgi:hypothetical protein